MEKKIEKANSIGGLISTWGKIIVVIIIFIISVGTAWYQIETNAMNNSRQDEQIKQLIKSQEEQFNRMMKSIQKEFDVWGQRSDKRYERAMYEAKKLNDKDYDHDSKLLELTKEIWYIKGEKEKR